MPLALVELFCRLKEPCILVATIIVGIGLSWCQSISNTPVTNVFAPSKDTIISRPEIYLKKAVSQLHFPGQCPIHRNHCVFSQQPLEIPLHMGV
jgi:hypothetical protein